MLPDCPERGRRRLQCKMCGPQVCHITVSCPKVVSSRVFTQNFYVYCVVTRHLRCDDDENVEKKKKNISVTCYNCGSQFHDASACKLPREAALLRMHRANQSASIAASIRSGIFNNGRGNSNLTCWNCNGVGHVSRDCPKKKMSARGGGRGRGRFRGRGGRRGGGRGGGGGHRGGSRQIHIGNKRKR